MFSVSYLCSNECLKVKWNKGFTNDIYRFMHEGYEYVLRIPKGDASFITSRDGEIMLMKDPRIQKYDVPTLFYDEKSGIKVTSLIKNGMSYSECFYEDKIEMVAHCMRSFHQEGFQCDHHFNAIEMLHNYQQQTTSFPFSFEGFQAIYDYISIASHQEVFCHNDWVDGNLLFANNRLYLIDYEYSGMNHPYFDVMSFLSENEIDDPLLRERFYHIYFDGDIPYQELKNWELFEDVLWCYWAWSMYERRKDDIYRQIAYAKANHYKSIK